MFIVLYTGGFVGGSIGPLPYDFTECSDRIEEINAIAKFKKADVVAICEFHNYRPENTLPDNYMMMNRGPVIEEK